MNIAKLPLRSAVAMLLALPILAFLPGCFGNDEASPDEATLTDAQDEVANGTTEMALQLDQIIAETVPGLFTDGVSTPARSAEATWDEATAT